MHRICGSVSKAHAEGSTALAIGANQTVSPDGLWMPSSLSTHGFGQCRGPEINPAEPLGIFSLALAQA